MKYNQAGIAFMPKAPKTAEATAITILRTISQRSDLTALYAQREPLYARFADAVIDNLADILTAL